MGAPLNLSLAVWEGDLCTQTALPKSLDLGRFVSEFRVIAYFNFKGRFGDIPQESHEVSQTAPAPHSLTLTSVGFHTSHFWVGTRSLARFLIGLILSGGKLRNSSQRKPCPLSVCGGGQLRPHPQLCLLSLHSVSRVPRLMQPGWGLAGGARHQWSTQVGNTGWLVGSFLALTSRTYRVLLSGALRGGRF